MKLSTKMNFFKFLEVICTLQDDESTGYFHVKEIVLDDVYFYVQKKIQENDTFFDFTFLQKYRQSDPLRCSNLITLFCFKVPISELKDYIFNLPNYKLSVFINILANKYNPNYNELV